MSPATRSIGIPHVQPTRMWSWSSTPAARVLNGVSIVVATLAVLIGWAPPTHSHGQRGGGTPDRAQPKEEKRELADVAEITTFAKVEVSGVSDSAPDAGAPEESPGDEIVGAALPYLGSRYVWGGTSPAGFDCSGFVYFVLGQTGHIAPRDHSGQMSLGPRVPRSDLEPGDLVFFRDTYTYGISHGGIYIGDGKFIHADDFRTGVIVSNVSDAYWANHWAAATRVAG